MLYSVNGFCKGEDDEAYVLGLKEGLSLIQPLPNEHLDLLQNLKKSEKVASFTIILRV